MKCINCDFEVDGKQDFCPHCGFDLRVQKKCYAISNMYYNQGLDRAGIRDLSGAIDMLQRSLKFNKYNVPARNLLGLTYFETGEAVAALSEWVISKNIMPEKNIASDYIQKLQADQARLDMINQTIKKYNEALKCCRTGNEDVAVIQLKKILSQNPKLIKAYHLIALVYIHKLEYEKARKYLKRAARIDKTNSTTLRFLKEVDEQTGTQTSLEPRHLLSGKKTEELTGIIPENLSAGETVIQPPAFHDTPAFAVFLNIALGGILGGLVVWFLITPAYKQKVNRAADEKITEYSTTMATQQKEMDNLQVQIDSLNDSTSNAQTQIASATTKQTAYENLLKAINEVNSGNSETAANAIAQVDSEQLSVDALAVYNTVYASLQGTMFQELVSQGQEDFDNANYHDALDKLLKAKEINATDYTVLNLIAHSYRLIGDNDNSIAAFQEIIDAYPNSKKAERAAESITQLGGTPQNYSGTITDDDETDADQASEEGAAEEETESGNTDSNGNAGGEETEENGEQPPEE